MNNAALEAHMRLASLPRWGRRTEPVDVTARRREAAEKAQATMRRDGTLQRGRIAPSVSQPSETYAAFKTAIDAGAKVRRKGRAPVGRHGFALGDRVEIVGGRYAGELGRYDGSVDLTRCFVMTKGGRRSVGAKFVRGVEA